MPRDGSGVYTTAPGTDGVAGQTIESLKYNANVHDVEQDLNTPRPIVAGGTGASNAHDALVSLHGEESGQVVDNYDSFSFVAGSFYSSAGATSAPTSGEHYHGICYVLNTTHLTVEARGMFTGTKYIRSMVGGVWGAWGRDIISTPTTPTDPANKAYVDAGDAAANAAATTAQAAANAAQGTANTANAAAGTAQAAANAAQGTANAAYNYADAANTNANNRVLRSGDNMSGTLTAPTLISYGVNYSLGGTLVSRSNGGVATVQLQRSDGANMADWYWNPADNVVTFWNHSAPVSISYTPDGTIWLSNGWKSKAGKNGGYGNDTINALWSGGQLQFYSNDTPIGAIACDYRIKKDVLPLPGMWDTVKALKPIQYTPAEFSPPSHADHIETSGPLYTASDVEHWGFLAHELQETLVPSVATGVKDDDVRVQSLNPAGIIAALTKALQEAMARIEALEAAP
jgi:hypothetical protein